MVQIYRGILNLNQKIMKIIIYFIAALILMPTMLAQAPKDDSKQMYWVREIQIKPGMRDANIALDKEYMENVKKHDIDHKYLLMVNDEDLVRYLTPINSLCDISTDYKAHLGEKMGNDKAYELFSKYNETATMLGDYILTMDMDLSIMKEEKPTDAGSAYHKWIIYYPYPGKSDEFIKQARTVRKLLDNKDTKLKSRIYRSGFGSPEEFFIASIPAKDEESYVNLINETGELIGEEFGRELDKFNKLCSKIKTEDVWFVPSMSNMK